MTLAVFLTVLDTVLGLSVFAVSLALAYRAGASATDRKYIQRAQQRAEQANRIARNMRKEYLGSPFTNALDINSAYPQNIDMPTALLPQVEVTPEAQYRAHA